MSSSSPMRTIDNPPPRAFIVSPEVRLLSYVSTSKFSSSSVFPDLDCIPVFTCYSPSADSGRA